MNNALRVAVAAAAVLVVAFIGIQVFGGGNVGGPPAVSPSPSSAPSASPSPRPSPSAAPEAVLPPEGDLAIGRHDLTLNGVSFSLAVPTSGWTSNGLFGIDHGIYPESYDGGFILWNNAADGVYADPCAREQGPRVGPSAADVAEAVANVPGTDATGPTDITVGGYPAKLVVVKIPEEAACTAHDFYLWWDEELTGRFATELGSTIRVWIVDVSGTLIQIDGETTKDAGPEVGQEIQQIVDSIQFE